MGTESPKVVVVGAGLSGCEAAWQIARMGLHVELWEMRPGTSTPAHRTGLFAELVCSNSLKSDELDSAQGLLKAELRSLGSLLISVADRTRLAAGKALAVDRDEFARTVTKAIKSCERIEVVPAEFKQIDPSQPTIIATGPLTSESLCHSLVALLGCEHLFFFDAIAPTVEAETVDMEFAFWGTRYRPSSHDYLNCPLNREQYLRFREALLQAEKVQPHDFEPRFLFEGCLPVEELARRGEMTLAFGPLKPVGLVDPRTGRRPFACVQLRRENASGTLLGLVGCQTRLKYSEQRRVFRMIPALRKARFARFGSMHKNLFVNSPSVLSKFSQARRAPNIFLAGQITGVEGYVESIASGLVAGVNAARVVLGLEPLLPPAETMIGALQRHITTAESKGFQPMNANFGLIELPPALARLPRAKRKQAISQAAIAAVQEWKKGLNLPQDGP